MPAGSSPRRRRLHLCRGTHSSDHRYADRRLHPTEQWAGTAGTRKPTRASFRSWASMEGNVRVVPGWHRLPATAARSPTGPCWCWSGRHGPSPSTTSRPGRVTQHRSISPRPSCNSNFLKAPGPKQDPRWVQLSVSSRRGPPHYCSTRTRLAIKDPPTVGKIRREPTAGQ